MRLETGPLLFERKAKHEHIVLLGAPGAGRYAGSEARCRGGLHPTGDLLRALLKLSLELGIKAGVIWMLVSLFRSACH